MTKSEKVRHCIGCTKNFYNDNNQIGVSECWHLKSARLVKRVRVSLWQRPPWSEDTVKVFQCRHERGYVLMTVENCRANNAACRESMNRERAAEQ